MKSAILPVGSKLNPLLSSILLSLCAIAFASCAPVSQNHYEKRGIQPLSAQQIETELVGRNLHMESIDFDAVVSIDINQTLNSKSLEGEVDSGHWTIEGTDTFCMQFSSWYFGDKQCYRIIHEKSEFLFFTLNGALSYSASVSSQIDNTQAVAQITNIPNDNALPTAETKKAPIGYSESPFDRKQRFIRLAKNCPECNLSGVDFSDAQLNRANLAGANLSGANFTNADLRQANLTGADLSDAILIRANLPGADLSYSNLTGADLSGSNLIRANVIGANINNTNTTGALLESIQGTIQ